MRLLCRIVLDENVVVETVVAVKDGHETHHFGTMRDVIGSIPLFLIALDEESRSGTHVGERTEAEVVDEGHTFGRHAEGAFRQKDVVVDESRAVRHLHEYVLICHHAAGFGA